MSTKKIVLKSSDGDLFEVDEAVVLQTKLLSEVVEDADTTTAPIPITHVSGNILRLVIEYCKKRADDVRLGSTSEGFKKWEATFVMKLDQTTIYDLILASNFLNIPSLLDLTCRTTADRIAACRDEHEIRQMLQIANDFTPDEEDKIRRDNHCYFQ